MSKSIRNLNLVYSDDSDNQIFVGAETRYDLKLLTIKGKGNRIHLGNHSDLMAFKVSIKGNSNVIVINENCKLIGGVNISRGARQSLRVGAGTSFQGVTLYLGENQSITIGDDCMFSARIEIRTTDSHSVIDADTGKRINKPGSITVGNHVWLGKDVIVSKGVTLASNIIVGAKAFVNRSFTEQFVAIAGVPARKVKDRVNWTRELLPLSEDE